MNNSRLTSPTNHLGHDGKTAEAHYLQVTPEHWERAKENATNGAESSLKSEEPPEQERRGNTGGNIRAISQAFTAFEAQKNQRFSRQTPPKHWLFAKKSTP
ncbi:hypothetical protein EC9_51450 [Rosistilla ulvae]|uniref:Uncharacterized protein n=1 Tax=Rosistilla ulvae TaxID=1930277 RepID=A0A517M815_9BACT|nr:hypothetical protein [Rosistilla ulvae]QDS90927.1 hypothetical protein EC9_51450 [Rosistilla ulvae]